MTQFSGSQRFAAFIAILLTLSGCAHKPAVIDENRPSPTPINSPSSTILQVVEAPVWKKEIPTEEFEGVVYKGLIWKDLNENEYAAWVLERMCWDLDIAMSESAKPSEYKDIVIPYEIRLKKNNAQVNLTLDPSNKDSIKHLKSREEANASYIVRKNGQTIQQTPPPFTHHGSGPFVNLESMLQLLDMSYTRKGSSFYISTEQNPEIAGKVFAHDKLDLGDQTKTDVQLIYYYNQTAKPNYRDVELLIGDQRIVLFDRNHIGSSDYYQSAFVETVIFQGEVFMQVHLDEDTVILKNKAGNWQPIFSNRQYVPYQNGALTLQTDTDGTARFVDRVNHVEKKTKSPDGQPNTLYQIDFLNFSHALTPDTGQKNLTLHAMVGARNKERVIFSAQIEFVYNGETFIPNQVTSWNEKKYGEDKNSGKLISSMDDYQVFDYKIP